jgi:hypothetical protein
MADRVNRKVSPDEVASLAAEGLPGVEIARRLGISRQRVHQIAASRGIQIQKIWTTPYYKIPSDKRNSPAPRLLTGGVLLTESQSAVGCVSELLAAADLVARGWHVYLPILRQRGHDIIAYSGEHVALIEVRSGRRTKFGNVTYLRKPNGNKPSYFAIVITGEPVCYEPDLPEDVKPLKQR